MRLQSDMTDPRPEKSASRREQKKTSLRDIHRTRLANVERLDGAYTVPGLVSKAIIHNSRMHSIICICIQCNTLSFLLQNYYNTHFRYLYDD